MRDLRAHMTGEAAMGRRQERKLVSLSDNRYDSRAICPAAVRKLCGKSKGSLGGVASGALHPRRYRECSPSISRTPTWGEEFSFSVDEREREGTLR